MLHSITRRAAALGIVSFAVLAGVLPAQEPAAPPEPLRIGVVETQFFDFSPALRKALLVPLNSLIQDQTGFRCESTPVKDVFEVARQLEDGKIHIGIVNGYELAWVQKKHPRLRPLALTVVKEREPVAYLVTHKESAVDDFDDCRQLSLPRRSRPHVRLFLEREAGEDGKYPFELRRHANIEEALDDLVRRRVCGVVVDKAALDDYGVVKPGCRKLLRIAEKSPTFPAGVVIYREGVLDRATLKKFSEGLFTAHKDESNRLLMNLWRLSSFDPVPQDYQQALQSIRTIYPAPGGDAPKRATPADTD
jgi:ABC-type phosphate/phosphonate transport system substrate-binding protein